MPVGFPDYYGGLTLPVTVEEGGTGQTSFTAGAVVIGQGTSALTPTNVGTANQILQVPAGGGDPVFQDIAIPVSTLNPPYPSSTPGWAFAVGTAPTGTDGAALWIQIASGVTIPPIRVVDDTVTTVFEVDTSGGISAASLALSTPLPVSSGGTGTSAPALVAGAGISITGSWPNNTITNSSNYATLAVPLPVASGGTGTSSPALTAGSNISLTGSWPDNTIAVTDPPTFSRVNISTTGGIGLLFGAQSDTGVYSPTLGMAFPAGSSFACFRILVAGASNFSVTTTGDVIAAGSLTLGTPLAVASGGTGTSAPALVAGGGITITGSWPNQTIALTAGSNVVGIDNTTDHTNQTANIGPATLKTPTSAGMYRMSFQVYIYNSSLSTDTVLAEGRFTQNGHTFTQTVLNVSLSAAGEAQYSGDMYLYCDASTNIEWLSQVTIASGDHYDIHVRLEAL